MSDLYYAAYNPDVLSCLANLSNDEVFTPPEVANAMLDMLPQELFSDPKTTFLDPGTKSGVFLREIVKRLLKGLEDQIPDLQTRLDHIMHEQVFGIAITEMTSLLARRSVYCSKYPNSKYSVSLFNDIQGNIRFKNMQHLWQNGKCAWCGVSQEIMDRGDDLEAHAYEFIHTKRLEDIFGMKFDVIIGNPPYQLNDGGNGVSAKPIYNLFVDQAKKLNPRYLTMIIPARWYSGGKGLDNFRASMLKDPRIRIIVDYTNSADCFPGVDVAGGICYFLWDRDHPGLCSFTNHHNGKTQTLEKDLSEYDTFIRYPVADSVVKKVKALNEKSADSIVSSRKPFGLPTSQQPLSSGDLKLRWRGGTGCFDRKYVTAGKDMIDKWKVMISRLTAEHAGQPDANGQFKILSTMELLEPGTICTETYLIAGAFNTETEARNYFDYLKTKFARFLISSIAITQQIHKGVFAFVPLQDFTKAWTDEELYAKYGLTDDEIAFIESMIKPMDLNGGE